MTELFASGRVVDLILGLMAIEATALALYARATGQGIAFGELVANIAAGASLLLALRSALTAEPWTTTALWLVAALATHGFDLARRWRR